jgi:hypothetical protein
MKRHAQRLLQSEIKAILADRKAGMGLKKIKEKYHRGWGTIQRVVNGKSNGNGNGKHTPVLNERETDEFLEQGCKLLFPKTQYLVIYGNGKGRRFENYSSEEKALQAVAQATLRGVKVRLWSEMPFEIKATVKE